MLRATGVQIPQDELDHLRSEEDGRFEDEDPQDLLGSLWLAFNTSLDLSTLAFICFGSLGGTIVEGAILVTGHLSLKVKVLPVGRHM